MLEQEIKLTATTSNTLKNVSTSPLVLAFVVPPVDDTPPQPLRFLAKYYDTENRVMEQSMCSLRARREGDKWKAAFKLKGQIVDGLSVREELECDINGWLSCADDLPSGSLKDRVLEL